MPPSRPTVAVVGAGMAGLAAAYALRDRAEVVLLDSSGQVGGKLRVSEVGGVPVDEGADALLRRVPYAVELAGQVGLGGQLRAPAEGRAYLLRRGRLRPMPAGTLLGIPTDLVALARSGVLSPAGLARVPADLLAPGPAVTADVSVGALVRRRLGPELLARLVDPLLGGVYAGRADALSLRATLPALAGPLGGGGSLVRAARAARGVPAPGPVFAGLPGGLGRLPAAVLAASGARLVTGAPVRALHRTAAGWRLEHGPATGPAAVDCDAVVLAVPAAPAARLLAGHVPADALPTTDYASVAIVTLVLRGEPPGPGSGYLLPAVEGRLTKAVTFTSRKWGDGPAGGTVLRASVGRHGEEAALQRDDGELVQGVLADLTAVHGPLGALVDSRVTRWGGALPQYAVGHLDRVARLRAALPPGLAVAGAGYDGVGVPAVVRSGQEAAARVLRDDGPHERPTP